MKNKNKNFHDNIIKINVGIIINFLLIIVNLLLIFVSLNKELSRQAVFIIILILIWNVLCMIFSCYLLNKKIPLLKKRYLLLSNIDNLYRSKKEKEEALLNKDLLINNSIDLFKLINYILVTCGIFFMLLMVVVIAL